MPTASPTPGAILLKLRFQPDEVRRYSFTMNVDTETPDGRHLEMEMNMGYHYRVIEVHPDGSATVILTIENMAVKANGERRDLWQISGSAVRMRMAPDGQISDRRIEKAPVGDEANMEAGDLSDLTPSIRYPATPLGVGESFDNQMPLTVPGIAQPIVMSNRMLLEELTTYRGRSAARLIETSGIPRLELPSAENDAIKLTGELGGRATHYIDVATGWAISGDGNMVLELRGSGSDAKQPVNLKMRLKLRYQEER